MKATYAVLSVFAMSVAGSVYAGGGPYPEPYVVQGESVKTGAEVRAELREAQRLGLVSTGEEGIRFAASEGSDKSHAEVAAELEEAQRLGLLTIGEEPFKVATPEQEQMIAEAGRRAAEQVLIAKGASE